MTPNSRSCGQAGSTVSRLTIVAVTCEIPMDVESVRNVFAFSESAPLRPDLVRSNEHLTETQIVEIFEIALPIGSNRSAKIMGDTRGLRLSSVAAAIESVGRRGIW